MKKILLNVIAGIVLFSLVIFVVGSSLRAADRTDKLSGKVYELSDKDDYDLGKVAGTSNSAFRFLINGNVNAVSNKDGFVSYDVKSGNLKITLDTSYGMDLYNTTDKKQWHIISDKNKKVDSTSLSSAIGTGAIIVQTSKDGKIWINVDGVTDMFANYSELNKRQINGEAKNSFYETTNIQIANGCYYRILVAYRLQREIEPTKVLFASVTNTEEKECIEIYQFHAFSSDVEQKEDIKNAKDKYEFSDVYRVDGTDGFKNPKRIDSDDPHVDWTVGKFYVSGYTSVITEGDIPVFLKVPGDKAALWFNLEQELDKCNEKTDIKVDYIDSGSDIYFGTPTIKNIGRGMLIVRKTDNLNQKERQIYTNYLEASATVGANTRIDLFEEGDYEVALDYQLHYDKPFVFGATTTKTLSYRVFFKFKVRNGDISAFIRDAETDQFLENGEVAKKGFYIDVANSKYLSLTIKREILNEGLDGLIADAKFAAVAQEGRRYNEEGVYTITVKNLVTNVSVEKKIYVGDRDILRAHMSTGLSLNEIKERLAMGATIDKEGNIIDPTPEEVEEDIEDEEPEESVLPITESKESEIVERSVNDEKSIEEAEPKQNKDKSEKNYVMMIVVTLVILALAAGVLIRFKVYLPVVWKRRGKNEND